MTDLPVPSGAISVTWLRAARFADCAGAWVPDAIETASPTATQRNFEIPASIASPSVHGDPRAFEPDSRAGQSRPGASQDPSARPLARHRNPGRGPAFGTWAGARGSTARLLALLDLF